jgi:hypothetical protein
MKGRLGLSVPRRQTEGPFLHFRVGAVPLVSPGKSDHARGTPRQAAPLGKKPVRFASRGLGARKWPQTV